MKVITGKVTSKTIPDGVTVEVDQFDSLDEAKQPRVLKQIGEWNEARALEYLNSKVDTETKNRVRAEYNQPVSQGKVKDEAMFRLTQLGSNELAALAGDRARMETKLAELMAEVREEWKANGKIKDGE